MEIYHYNDETDLIAVGFDDGRIALCYVDNSDISPNLKLFFVQRLFKNNIKQIQFDMNGELLACVSRTNQKYGSLY